MDSSGRIIRDALLEAYDSFSQLAIANILWFILTIPLVTAPPAAAGLFFYTHELAHRHPVDWRTFFTGFRKYFWLSWIWAVTNLVAIIILGVNAWFYMQVKTAWAPWMAGFFVGILVLWLLLQMYTFPLLLEQTDQRMRVALRNSVVLYLKRAGFSLALVFIVIPFAIISTIIPPLWIIITAAASAFLVNNCMIYLIDDISMNRNDYSAKTDL